MSNLLACLLLSFYRPLSGLYYRDIRFCFIHNMGLQTILVLYPARTETENEAFIMIELTK